MATEPLFFHVREQEGACTFSVQKFDSRNLSVGYAVTHSSDHFCKRTGRRIAQERSSHILKNPDKNASRPVSEDRMLLPHLVRKNIENVVKKSAELLKLGNANICAVTWADRRNKGGLVQMDIAVDSTEESSEVE